MNIAIIPAKSQSKRLPGKNIRLFHGKPMLSYPIQTALESGLFQAVYVSTDSPAIEQIAKVYGAVPWRRESRLVGDEFGPQAIAGEVLGSIKAENACVIYPCTPLMTVEDLKRGFYAIRDTSACYAFAIGRDPLRDAGAWYWGRRWAWLGDIHLFCPNSAMIPIPDERVCDVNVQKDWDDCERKYAAMQCV